MSDGRYKKKHENSHREWNDVPLFSAMDGICQEQALILENDRTVAVPPQTKNINIRFRAHMYDIQYVHKLLFHSAVCPAKCALSHKRPMCSLSELISRVFLYSNLKRKQFCVIHVHC